MQQPELVNDLVQMATWVESQHQSWTNGGKFWTALLAYFSRSPWPNIQERARLASANNDVPRYPALKRSIF